MPDTTSSLLKTAVSTYDALFGMRPQITATHAGLECGLLRTHHLNLAMISIGPNITGAHSPKERLQIPSVTRGWLFPADPAAKHRSRSVTGVRASPLDRFQLYLGDEEHAFLLSVAATISGRVDLYQLMAAAERVADATTEIRFRYRGWEDSGSFVVSEEKIPDQVMTKLASVYDPLFTITVCRGKTDAVVFSAAHLLTDDRGLLQIAAAIADQYRGAEKTSEEVHSAGGPNARVSARTIFSGTDSEILYRGKIPIPGPAHRQKIFSVRR